MVRTITAAFPDEARENGEAPASPASTSTPENRISSSTSYSIQQRPTSSQAVPRAFTQIYDGTLPRLSTLTPLTTASTRETSSVDKNLEYRSLSEIIAERWTNLDEASKRRYLSRETDESRASTEQSEEEDFVDGVSQSSGMNERGEEGIEV